MPWTRKGAFWTGRLLEYREISRTPLSAENFRGTSLAPVKEFVRIMSLASDRRRLPPVEPSRAEEWTRGKTLPFGPSLRSARSYPGIADLIRRSAISVGHS
ncbi:hypothetical protein R1flu_016028 [Riccia fluitans]|uniref:Uncharacterized protein n=1 Tax=Riccia fluitans TaxID=41844 RepID=A0ABD1YPI1_9MARC